MALVLVYVGLWTGLSGGVEQFSLIMFFVHGRLVLYIELASLGCLLLSGCRVDVKRKSTSVFLPLPVSDGHIVPWLVWMFC